MYVSAAKDLETPHKNKVAFSLFGSNLRIFGDVRVHSFRRFIVFGTVDIVRLM